MAEDDPGFDPAAAHRHFAVEYFSAAWELIEKPERTASDEDEMLLRAFAAALHWSRRPDCGPKSRSISYWQLSRALALVGDVFLAERYARACLDVSVEGDLPPFFVAYAHEALARAAAVAGRADEARWFAARARDLAEKVYDADARKQLTDDLATIA